MGADSSVDVGHPQIAALSRASQQIGIPSANGRRSLRPRRHQVPYHQPARKAEAVVSVGWLKAPAATRATAVRFGRPCGTYPTAKLLDDRRLVLAQQLKELVGWFFWRPQPQLVAVRFDTNAGVAGEVDHLGRGSNVTFPMVVTRSLLP